MNLYRRKNPSFSNYTLFPSSLPPTWVPLGHVTYTVKGDALLHSLTHNYVLHETL